MTKHRNVFAHITTLEDLKFRFECATEPENLFADGERTRTQAKAMFRALSRDYQHRESEIRLAELNAKRGTPTTA